MSVASDYAAGLPKTMAVVQSFYSAAETGRDHLNRIFELIYAIDHYEGPGRVYFIAAPSTHLVKIGRSINPVKRLAQLQLLSPVLLTIAGIINGDSAVEVMLHEHFAYLHSHGEWFHGTPELMRFIAAVCGEYTS